MQRDGSTCSRKGKRGTQGEGADNTGGSREGNGMGEYSSVNSIGNSNMYSCTKGIKENLITLHIIFGLLSKIEDS